MLNNWINGNGVVEDHQAIDILGFPNPACSSDDDSDEGSNKLRSSLNLDLRYNFVIHYLKCIRFHNIILIFCMYKNPINIIFIVFVDLS